MSKPIRILLLSAIAPLGLASAAHAGFVAIATSGSQFGNFYTNQRVSTDGSDVVFIGSSNGTETVYDYNILSQALTPVAATGSTYTSLSFPSVSGSVVGFQGQNNSAEGIYTVPTTGGSITTLADQTTNMPSSSPSSNFYYFDQPTLSGGNVVFAANSYTTLPDGIYFGSASSATSGGSNPGLNRVVDSNTALPGSPSSIGEFFNPSLSGSVVAFGGVNNGSNSAGGIFTSNTSGGNIVNVANYTSAVPGSSSNHFSGFGSPLTDGTSVVFEANYGTANPETPTGIFLYGVGGGAGTVVANNSTPIPGHPGQTFSDPLGGGYAISDGIVAFTGGSDSVYGIYAYANGQLFPIIESGDSLDGSTVEGLSLYDQGINNGIDQIAFYATLQDGTSGIFLNSVPISAFDVPEPSALALLGIGSLLTLRRRRPLGA